MSRKLKVAALVLLALLIVAAGVGIWSYRAVHHVPEFYTQAIKLGPVDQNEASRELEARVTTLFNDARNEDHWRALFTDEQINSWLAVDFARNYGRMLPPSIRDPRVHISPEMVTLALKYEDESISTVLSLGMEAYVSDSNEVALRIRKVRAGALPLPLDDVLQTLTEAARRSQLPLRWAQVEGDPVALIRIDFKRDRDGKTSTLEAVELYEGQLYVSGRKSSGESDDTPAAAPEAAPMEARVPSPQRSQPLE